MSQRDYLKKALQSVSGLELAVLIGSQANGTATAQSDWDIAVLWERSVSGLARLQHMESLKKILSDTLCIHREHIDLIDMACSRLAMRAVIVEEGIVLKGEESLAWSHYLIRTWGELEDFYWRLSHAS